MFARRQNLKRYLWRMKIPHKILLAYSLIATVFIITGFSYVVSCRHAALVTPEKMNVFYIGVDNPVQISACGASPASLKPTISGGSLAASGNGKYIVRVTGGVQATITVASGDSVGTKLGVYKFRVKRVPDPVAYFGNLKADGLMTKAELGSQSGIFARMENFDFDIKFMVISFEMALLVNGKWKELKANGPALTPEMKAELRKVASGEKVLFDKVTVKGPDGTLRKIPGVMITVK